MTMVLPPTASALVVIGFGLVLTFYGYALWRLALVVGGFAIGFIVGSEIAPPDQQALALVLGAVLAVAFGILSYFAYTLVSILIGVVMGALAGLVMALLLGVNVADANTVSVNALALVGVGAIVGVALGFALRDLIIVLLTAIGGGGAIVIGLQTLLPLLNPAWASWATGITPFIVWAMVAVLGILVQYAIFRRRLTGNMIPG
jgi:hypothetical protein